MRTQPKRNKGGGALHPLTKPLMVEMLRARGSHRAQVIIAGVYVDALLQQMLEAAFIEDRCVKDFFNAQAPLSSFHWKIEIAFGMGLIPGPSPRPASPPQAAEPLRPQAHRRDPLGCSIEAVPR